MLAFNMKALTSPVAGQLHFQFGEIDPLAFQGCFLIEDLFPVARAPPV